MSAGRHHPYPEMYPAGVIECQNTIRPRSKPRPLVRVPYVPKARTRVEHRGRVTVRIGTAK